MSGSPNKLSQFWQELKRRKVIRIITVYAAAAFVILELVDIIAPNLGLPGWTFNLILILLCVGFVISVILSWIYDIHPEGGIIKTELAHEAMVEDIPRSSISWKIASYISFVVIIALIVINIVSLSSRSREISLLEKSIAVLPFDNLSPDDKYDHIGDAFTDEIILELQKIHEFERVLSRSSTMQYKVDRPTMPEIAEKLGVNYIIEGSIQRYEEKVSIRVQVIRARNEDHIWAEEYNSKWEDIFSIQDEIAFNVANELKTAISPNEVERIERQPTDNSEAYNLYLKGRTSWNSRTEDGLTQSVFFFKQAIELDSNYALAYAGLADSYFIMAWWGWHPVDDGYLKGKEYARIALSRDNNIAEAHATLGGIATWYDWNWEEAEDELKKAISINPNYATAHQWYAELLDILGRDKEARDQIDIAYKLSPNIYQMMSISGLLYYHNSEFRKAIEFCQKILDTQYRLSAYRTILKSYYNLGMEQETLVQMKKIVSIEHPGLEHGLLDEIYLESGIDEVFRWFMNWVTQNNLTSNYDIAALYALHGESDLAIHFLEKGLDLGESGLLRINNNPDFNSLRTDPRFQALINTFGLN
jgi:TolB-like protein